MEIAPGQEAISRLGCGTE